MEEINLTEVQEEPIEEILKPYEESFDFKK